MKTFKSLLVLAFLSVCLVSCTDFGFNVDYRNSVQISFADVDETNIVYLEKGTLDYTLKVSVTSNDGLVLVESYEINPRTGAQGALLSSETLDGSQKSYSFDCPFTDLTANKGILIAATDKNSNRVVRRMMVCPAEAVEISEQVIAETADVYYGTYYAHWYTGRVYMRSTPEIEKYKDNIDIAFAEVGGAPCAISPSSGKGDYKPAGLSGLHSTKLGATDLTAAQFNAVNKVDASPVSAVPDPTDDCVELVAGKVYVFLRDDGVKGLFRVVNLAAKTAMLETAPDTWESGSYHQLALISKTIVK